MKCRKTSLGPTPWGTPCPSWPPGSKSWWRHCLQRCRRSHSRWIATPF